MARITLRPKAKPPKRKGAELRPATKAKDNSAKRSAQAPSRSVPKSASAQVERLRIENDMLKAKLDRERKKTKFLKVGSTANLADARKLRARVADLRMELKGKDQTIKERDVEVRRLEEMIASRDYAYRRLEEVNAELMGRIPEVSEKRRGPAEKSPVRDSLVILADGHREDVKLTVTTVRPTIRTPPRLKQGEPKR